MRNRTANTTISIGMSTGLPFTGEGNSDGKKGRGVCRNVPHLFCPGSNGNGAGNGAVTGKSHDFARENPFFKKEHSPER
jgi:hypothetical protein